MFSLLPGCPEGSHWAAQHQKSLPCPGSRVWLGLRSPAETPFLICSLH